jgi:hypothetical protein
MARYRPQATIAGMHKHLIVSAVVIAAVVGTGAGAGAGAATPSAHWCREGDPPIYASAGAACGLAGNVVTDYVNLCHEVSKCQIQVDLPASRVRYPITCNRTGSRYTGTVYCQGPADTGIWTRFSALV